jgi:O-methyltransferase
MIVKLFNKMLKPLGYQLSAKQTGQSIAVYDIISDASFMRLYERCKPYTMTSIERLFSLYQSLNYIFQNQIEGDFVECGVWKGGSSMMIALYLQEKGIRDRRIYMYDTFEGMSEPSEFDKSHTGDDAKELLSAQEKTEADSIWCYSALEEVKSNLSATGFPSENLVFIKGKVEDTLNNNLPGRLALLRLDTDWYESTKKELVCLYPLLNQNGILIIDDFGHWEGAKKAVLEYFSENKLGPLLHRIDNTGRIMVKY